MSALKINMLQRAVEKAVTRDYGFGPAEEWDAIVASQVIEDLTNLAAYAPKNVIERTIKKWEASK